MKIFFSYIILGIIMFFGCIQSTMAGFFSMHEKMMEMDKISHENQENCCDSMHEECEESVHECCESFFKYSLVSQTNNNEEGEENKKIKFSYQYINIFSQEKWENYFSHAPPQYQDSSIYKKSQYTTLIGIIKNNC